MKLEKDREVIAKGGGEITKHILWTDSYCLSAGYLHGITEPYLLLDLLNILVNPMINALCHGCKEKFKSEVDKAMSDIDPNALICEMEIPAGERYWEGVTGGICAKRMIFKRTITPTRMDFLQWLLQWILVTEPYYKGSSNFEKIIGICKEIEPELTFEEE